MKDMRDAKKWRQSDVASRLGVSSPTITKHEQNPSSISLSRLIDYANLYKVDAFSLWLKIWKDPKTKLFRKDKKNRVNLNAFGAEMKRLRGEMSQEKFGKKLKIPQSLVSSIEAGTVSLTWFRVESIAKATKLPMSHLVNILIG